ncbi:MAG: hypothetical protein WCD56_18695 [Pseudolabrys sp.]
MATLAKTEGNAAQHVSFYFAAHQDDWQLFMNPSAFHDVLDASTKTVFVHMTAGDAGLGTKPGGGKRRRKRNPFHGGLGRPTAS